MRLALLLGHSLAATEETTDLLKTQVSLELSGIGFQIFMEIGHFDGGMGKLISNLINLITTEPKSAATGAFVHEHIVTNPDITTIHYTVGALGAVIAHGGAGLGIIALADSKGCRGRTLQVLHGFDIDPIDPEAATAAVTNM
jgi:hypothetical protein